MEKLNISKELHSALLLNLKDSKNDFAIIGTPSTIIGYFMFIDSYEECFFPAGSIILGLLLTHRRVDVSKSSFKYAFRVDEDKIRGSLHSDNDIPSEIFIDVNDSTLSLQFLRFKSTVRINNFNMDAILDNQFISSISNNLFMRFSSGLIVGLNEVNKKRKESLRDCLEGYFPDITSSDSSSNEQTTVKENKGKQSKKGKKGKGPSKKQVTNIKLPKIPTPLECMSWGDMYTVNGISSGIIVNAEPNITDIISTNTSVISIDIDLLCACSLDSSVSDAANDIRSGILSQIRGMKSQLLQLNRSSGHAKAFHYRPSSLPFPITRIHIMDSDNSVHDREVSLSDDGSIGQENRRRLHVALGLSLNRPLFRIACAETFSSSTSTSADGKLNNVHIGLPSSTVSGGQQWLVQGDYTYYHYLQDQINDKGWGCAYRSLQTVVSWFHLNHYISSAVPTHADIQQALHSIGDKPKAFIGSHEWIGSMEVGFYLDSQLDISWRNISVTSGPELASKARELALHFEEQGTPIMMGGGNLAFTLLGIDWNSSTGDVKFLILDPHYTGADDLVSIQKKPCMMEGYKATPCGWRSADSFSKTSFYNLCVPQRPLNAI
eukprot:gene6409-12960_t